MNTALRHLVELTALRDRTAFAARLIQALTELLPLQKAIFFRRYSSGHRNLLYPCAGSSSDGCSESRFVRNVYLPDPTHFVEAADDPTWLQVLETRRPLLDQSRNPVRWLYPILFNKECHFLLDLTFTQPPNTETRILAKDLCLYVTHHLSLIEYSETDTLTGLPNRKTFNEHLFRVLGHAHPDLPEGEEGEEGSDGEYHRRRDPGTLAKHWLAVLDIDHFKRINDSYGHLIGDEVLVLVARLLRESTRLDNPIFRMGGEEFVILLQPTTLVDAEKALNRLRQTVSEHPFPQIGQVTLSGGFSCVQPFDAPDDILDRADEALYYAKAHGRNQIAAYERLLEQGKIQKKSLLNEKIEMF